MTVQINYKKSGQKKPSNNLILFTDDKFSKKTLEKYLSSAEFSYISDLLKNSDFKKNLFVFEMNSRKNIILISIKKDLKNFEIENLGAELYGRINIAKKK